MSEEKPGTINLGKSELSQEDEAAYRERIRAAKAGGPITGLKGNTPLGGVERPKMPVLSRTQETVSAPSDGVQPRPPGSPLLRPETVKQIDDAVKAGRVMDEQASAKAIDEEKLKEDAKLADLFSQFDFADSRNQVDRILDNRKRREQIEARCTPMSLEDLLMKDEVQQSVPILPDKFEARFRSITPVESLYLKSLMSKESIQTDQYLGEKYNLLLLTCSVLSINGALFPEHRKFKQDGTFEVDDKLFQEKLGYVMRKSGYVIADLGVNYMWFDIRVRKLLNPDELKNG
jgi:hypothetical protein